MCHSYMVEHVVAYRKRCRAALEVVEGYILRGSNGVEAGASPTGSSRGLVLLSVGRDLAFEAGLLERLGRLVCEAALIEVVDVHKEVRKNRNFVMTS